MNILKVSEETAKIAILLNVILGVIYTIVSLTENSANLLSKGLVLLFILGFGFFFLWISAFFTYMATFWFSKIYWLSFILSIGVGVCLALLSLKFSEIFFIYDIYFYVFVMLGILGGVLVFISQQKINHD